MRSEQELVAAANANFLASFRKLTQHSAEGDHREIDGVFAFVTGLPVPLFNGCVVADGAHPARLEEALTWVRKQRVAHRVWIAESLVGTLGSVPLGVGLERDSVAYPNMILVPVPAPPSPAEGVAVRSVGGSDVEDFLRVSVELGLSRGLAERLFSAGFVADTDVRLFAGWLDGRPAGTSLAIRSGSASGVYNVGVVQDARRRGVGSALTWAAVDAGRSWGCEAIVLQSSVMALSMYEEIGFRTVVSYAVFGEKKPPAIGGKP